MIKKTIINSWQNLTILEKKTFFPDTIRNSIHGLFQTLSPTLFLLILIQYYEGGDFLNSLIVSGGALGLISGLFVPYLFFHMKMKISKLLSIISLTSSLFLFAAAWVKHVELYSILIVLFIFFYFLRIPLQSAIYASNYNIKRRAVLTSPGIMISTIVAFSTSLILGNYLEDDLLRYRLVLSISSIVFALSAIYLTKIPSESLTSLKSRRSGSPLKLLKLIFDYPVFGLVLFSWFFLGFANHATVPLRVLYLAEEERGLGLSPEKVLFILGVIPAITQFSFSFLWAKLFDKMHFLNLRIILNIFMMFGLGIFFLTTNIYIIILGVVLMNICLSGSPYIWHLWVTKIAPEGKSSDFMAVHTFLTGIRGLIGPFLAMWFIQKNSISTMSIISVALIFTSIIILFAIKFKYFKSNKLAE